MNSPAPQQRPIWTPALLAFSACLSGIALERYVFPRRTELPDFRAVAKEKGVEWAEYAAKNPQLGSTIGFVLRVTEGSSKNGKEFFRQSEQGLLSILRSHLGIPPRAELTFPKTSEDEDVSPVKEFALGGRIVRSSVVVRVDFPNTDGRSIFGEESLHAELEFNSLDGKEILRCALSDNRFAGVWDIAGFRSMMKLCNEVLVLAAAHERRFRIAGVDSKQLYAFISGPKRDSDQKILFNTQIKQESDGKLVVHKGDTWVTFEEGLSIADGVNQYISSFIKGSRFDVEVNTLPWRLDEPRLNFCLIPTVVQSYFPVISARLITQDDSSHRVAFLDNDFSTVEFMPQNFLASVGPALELLYGAAAFEPDQTKRKGILLTNDHSLYLMIPDVQPVKSNVTTMHPFGGRVYAVPWGDENAEKTVRVTPIYVPHEVPPNGHALVDDLVLEGNLPTFTIRGNNVHALTPVNDTMRSWFCN